MGEVLCKYKGLAPWIGMGLTVVSTVVVNVWIAAYSYGMLQQRQVDFERRLARIEASDVEQNHQLGESASRLARIEAGVDWIKQAFVEHKSK